VLSSLHPGRSPSAAFVVSGFFCMPITRLARFPTPQRFSKIIVIVTLFLFPCFPVLDGLLPFQVKITAAIFLNIAFLVAFIIFFSYILPLRSLPPLRRWFACRFSSVWMGLSLVYHYLDLSLWSNSRLRFCTEAFNYFFWFP